MPIARKPRVEKNKHKSTGSGNNNRQKVDDTKHTVLMDCRGQKPTLTSYICMFLSLGWIMTIPIVLIILPLFWIYHRLLFWLLSGTIALSAIYTADRDYQPRWGYAIGAWIMRNVSCYFQFRIEFEDLDALKEAGASIHIMEPHGVFPIAIFWGSLKLIPGMEMLCGLSSSIFTIPMMKHALTWCGATNIARENISRYLNEGVSINICAGGVQEIPYWGNIDKEMVLYLQTRFGVTKLAMTHGVSIVPSLCFGLENAYGCYMVSHPILLSFARKIGFFPMLFTGLLGIPFGQPKPCALCAVIGTPIKVAHIANPTPEQVAVEHQRILDAYVKLYNDNKGRFGMNHVKLRLA